MDYAFTFIELRLDENNEGAGTLAVGVELKYDQEWRPKWREPTDRRSVSGVIAFR
jgi:hypothetical protein